MIKKRFLLLLPMLFCSLAKMSAQDIVSGVAWYDQNARTVNAHGGCLVREGDRWWLFGEWKGDDSNAFQGFSCYSSENLTDWRFERLALPVQQNGVLGPDRVGERPKVLRCGATGKYVMLAHADDLGYKDPCTVVAVADSVNGEYRLQGPLLYHGKPLRHWDIGAFQDTDGNAYLLAHHGPIYRLSADYLSVDTMVAKVEGAGESPCMFKAGDTYFYLTSNLTSWERNDNYYLTAPAVEGPWTRRGLFCPEGTLTWNSQCSYVAPMEVLGDTLFMYMGDRWSYPRQGSAATYVWQPLTINGTELRIPEFLSSWNPQSKAMERYLPNCLHQNPDALIPNPFKGFKRKSVAFSGDKSSERFEFPFKGSRVGFESPTDKDCGYARVEILHRNGEVAHSAVVDFYSLTPSRGPRYLSPRLPRGKYILRVQPLGQGGEWFNKRGDRFGSVETKVNIDRVYVMK